MKSLLDEKIEFITPCFCAGADQSKAEIRAPSIRGELRWWFRVLGGDSRLEAKVFGSAAGDKGSASSIIVRVSNVEVAKKVDLPSSTSNEMDDLYYLLHYAKASSDGKRYQSSGYLSPSTTFKLHILQRYSIDHDARALFDISLKCFLRLGSLGLRKTRACGAFSTVLQPAETFKEWCRTPAENLKIAWLCQENTPVFCKDWLEVMEKEALIIKTFRKEKGYTAGKSSDNPTPFGRSNPRQASAVHLRPVRLKEGYLPIVFYTPKILGKECKNSSFTLRNVDIGTYVLRS